MSMAEINERLAVDELADLRAQRRTGGELQLLTREEAFALTSRIKLHAEALWALLLEAHDRQAWHALGYRSWSAYVGGEFDMTRARSYQLLDQGRAIRAIEQAAGVRHPTQHEDTVVSTDVDITEAQARDIKPRLPEVTQEIERRVEAEPDPAPERVQQIVDETVDHYRQTTPEGTTAAVEAIEEALEDDDEAESVVETEPAPQPSPAVAEFVESAQTVQDSRYTHNFLKALGRDESWMTFDAERLGHLLDQDAVEAIERHAARAARFADAVKRARSGLRVIDGGA